MDRVRVTAPGRVNLLGEHVDYNGGRVLPAAIDLRLSVTCARRQDGLIELFSGDSKRPVRVGRELDAHQDVEGKAIPSWALYPAGVAWALRGRGLEVAGISATVRSDLPIGVGLSSSAALEVAFALAWQALGGWGMDRMSLAKVCQRAENDYVGMSCGLMDQFAVLHGVRDHALLFDTRNLAWEKVPFPRQAAIVIADSGVRRELVSSGYNERRRSCEEAVSQLRARLPGLPCLADVTPTQLEKHVRVLDPVIAKRARHVVEECERVRRGIDLLRRGDATGFGELMYEGHASLRDLYEVSCRELDVLVETARTLPGCFGSRLTGAGFGGCTVSLVDWNHVEEFTRGLAEGYHRETGRQASVFVTRASDGAEVTAG